jgi:diguanylate cyclase (GGDEF)-like protein/PAS domain S-box-containing protein
MLDSWEDYRSLFDSAPDLAYTQDLHGQITRVNRAFEKATGYSREQAVGRLLDEIVAPECRSILSQAVMERMGGAPVRAVEVEFLAADGRRIAFEVTTQLIFAKGIPVGIQGLGRDITDQKRELKALSAATAQLTEKTEQLAAFTAHLRVLHRLSTTAYHAIEALFTDYLEAGCEIFGFPFGAITQVGNDDNSVRFSHGPEPVLADPCAASVIQEKATILASSCGESMPDGCYIGTPLFAGGALFGCIGFWSSSRLAHHPQAREIIELMAKGINTAVNQRQLNIQLDFLATHDALTNLPNRLLLGRRLESALSDARERQSELALVFIDLDRFKGINDSLGHAVGDAVLKQVSARFQACMRAGDTLARMGGDEFTAILPGIRDRTDAIGVGHRLLRSLHEPCHVEGYDLFVTASVGISMFPRDGADAGTLLRNADAAMYSAKRLGRDDVQVYASADTDTAVERLSVETYLRRALDREEFRLCFQPQVDMDGLLAGAEVLLAWSHPELGRVSPSVFIPIAEETGMILPIGNWVLREACTQAARWLNDVGQRFTIAVNVSALQFSQAGFVESVAIVLGNTGLPPELLELEVTESLLLRDLREVADSLGRLRRLGVRIAIDDFGTGYSSLSYIRNLPLDVLKVDRSFVANSEDDRSALALLRAIVALGHTLGLRVTAEGVETEAQLKLVRRAGCDVAQGHLFGAPLDAADMEAVIRCGRHLTPQPAAIRKLRRG